MSASEIQIFLASIGAFLVILAGGTKWLLTHIENQQIKAAQAESALRTQLADRLHEEIRGVKLELLESQATNRLYLKRIYQLEALILKLTDLDLPELIGWPPE